jgi:hypothetical protein
MHLFVLSSYRMTAVFPGETEMEIIFTISYVVRNVKQKQWHRNMHLVKIMGTIMFAKSRTAQ